MEANLKYIAAAIVVALGVSPALAGHAKVAKKQHKQYRASGPADPSFDRYGRRYRPTVKGPCMVDLGYGRFARCDGSL